MYLHINQLAADLCLKNTFLVKLGEQNILPLKKKTPDSLKNVFDKPITHMCIKIVSYLNLPIQHW